MNRPNRPAVLAAVTLLVVLAPAVAVPAAAAGASAPSGTAAGASALPPTAGAAAIVENAVPVASGHDPATWSTGERVHPCSYPLSITDATGTEVTIEEAPERVVTMAPSAAQTAWDIGARDKVVGVSQHAGYLEGADEKANVSAPGFGQYNIERMVELDPDVVIAPNVIQNQTVEQVREAGLTVVRLEEATTIEDIKLKTGVIGQLTGECHAAEELIEWMERNLGEVRGAVATVEQPRAIYITAGYAAGDDTFINDMMRVAGARNIFAEAGVAGYQPVSEEIIADRNPEWIILSNPESTVPEETPYTSTTAVHEGNILQIDPNYISQPAPRSVVYAVRNMTEAFHPESFEDVDYVPLSEVRTGATTTTTEPTTTTTTGATDGDDSPADGTPADGDGEGDGEDTGLPGFGALVGIVAVLAALAVLSRRR